MTFSEVDLSHTDKTIIQQKISELEAGYKQRLE